jgi:hypothetical protein
MAHVHCMLHTYCYKHTHTHTYGIYNAYCLSPAVMVARTRLNVTVYVYCVVVTFST